MPSGHLVWGVSCGALHYDEVCGWNITASLEHHKDGYGQAVLAVAEVGSPAGDDRPWSTAGISSWGSDASGAGEVGDVRGTVVVLEAVGKYWLGM